MFKGGVRAQLCFSLYSCVIYITPLVEQCTQFWSGPLHTQKMLKRHDKTQCAGILAAALVLCWETPVRSGQSCRAATAAGPLSDAHVESPTPRVRQAPPAFPGTALCLEKCYCPNATCSRRDIFPFGSDIFPLPSQV